MNRLSRDAFGDFNLGGEVLGEGGFRAPADVFEDDNNLEFAIELPERSDRSGIREKAADDRNFASCD